MQLAQASCTRNTRICGGRGFAVVLQEVFAVMPTAMHFPAEQGEVWLLVVC